MQRMIQKFLCTALLLFAFHATAQESEKFEDSQEAIDKVAKLADHLHQEAENAKKADKNTPLKLPKATPADYLDADGRAALRESMRSYYAYKTEAFQHRQRVFEWQLLSSKVIFVVVIFLVLVGLYFSWLQFKADMAKGEGTESADQKADDKSPQPPAQATPNQPVSTIEASTTGIKVSSPVLGVIILVISLAFFYLYLQYVYPIEELL